MFSNAGALDITEEVGAAVGIPHVGQIWQEVHRSHTRSRTPIIEEPGGILMYQLNWFVMQLVMSGCSYCSA